MTSSPRQDRDGPRAAEKAFRLVLKVSLADGEPVSGTVSVIGRPPAVPFHGWMDLMGAINSLRATLTRPHTARASLAASQVSRLINLL